MIDLRISVKIPTVGPDIAKNQFDEFRQRTEKDAQKIMLDTIHQEIVSRNLRVEGDLYESWDTDVEGTGDIRRIIATTTDIAAPALEYGTRPAQGGTNSLSKSGTRYQEILSWASKKGINPRYGTLEQYAWAIARKIGRQGLPLRGGLKRPFNAAQKKAVRKIERMYDKEIELLVRKLNS